MRMILSVLCVSLGLMTGAATAAVSVPKATGVEPVTPEQETTHTTVLLMQDELRKALKENASPEEIGRAKADVQKARVEANREDMNQFFSGDEIDGRSNPSRTLR